MFTRSDGSVFGDADDERSIQCFEALELLYWNKWETCCKFEDALGQNEAMRKISFLQDMKHEFKKDILGR